MLDTETQVVSNEAFFPGIWVGVSTELVVSRFCCDIELIIGQNLEQGKLYCLHSIL